MLHLRTRVQNVLLHLLLLLVGLYAGMHFFHEMCPVESQMKLLEYARYWKIVDGTFMHRRMGVMGLLMIGVFVLNIAGNKQKWRSYLFLLLAVSFALLIVEVAFTVNQQLPIIAFINQSDLEHISGHDLSQLGKYQQDAIHNFQNRFWLALASFICISLAPFARKTVDRVITLKRHAVLQ